MMTPIAKGRHSLVFLFSHPHYGTIVWKRRRHPEQDSVILGLRLAASALASHPWLRAAPPLDFPPPPGESHGYWQLYIPGSPCPDPKTSHRASLELRRHAGPGFYDLSSRPDNLILTQDSTLWIIDLGYHPQRRSTAHNAASFAQTPSPTP